MGTTLSVPEEQWQYKADKNGEINCGVFTINQGADITQINILCALEGNFTDKTIKLTLTSIAEPTRILEFYNHDLDYSGNNQVYVSFMTKFHAKDNDSYQAKLYMAPAGDADLFAVADFDPKNNDEQKDDFIPAARIEIYEK